MSARMLTIPEASQFLWGRDTRSMRKRTREFLMNNGVKMLKDGKQYFVRRVDLVQLAGEDDE
jgi:hypothetical protein